VRQRIVIALLTDPVLIIADEPTTTLDVTIPAEIMDLLGRLCASEEMGLMLITHDLSVVDYISTRVAVMSLETLCEAASARELFGSPRYLYTRSS
jgi:peptide/nickel transport system ATP-binding protein